MEIALSTIRCYQFSWPRYAMQNLTELVSEARSSRRHTRVRCSAWVAGVQDTKVSSLSFASTLDRLKANVVARAICELVNAFIIHKPSCVALTRVGKNSNGQDGRFLRIGTCALISCRSALESTPLLPLLAKAGIPSLPT